MGKSHGIANSAMSLSNTQRRYRRADKFLARPGMKQHRNHLRDARNFSNIETLGVINFFFSAMQNTEGNSRHCDRNISLSLLDRALS